MAHTHQVLSCTSELCLKKCPLRATGGERYLQPLRRAGAPRRPSATSGPRAVDSECLLRPLPSSQAAGRGEAGVSVCGQCGWAAHPSPRHREVELAGGAWVESSRSCSWRTWARGGRLVSGTHSPLPPAGSHVTGQHACGPRQSRRFHRKQAAFSVRAVPPAPPSEQLQQPLQCQRTSTPPARGGGGPGPPSAVLRPSAQLRGRGSWVCSAQ